MFTNLAWTAAVLAVASLPLWLLIQGTRSQQRMQVAYARYRAAARKR